MAAPNVKSKTKKEDKDSWATPKALVKGSVVYFNRKNLIFNNENYIDLDVCASAHNTKSVNYFDETTNGLVQPWGKRLLCWCNPPYSRGQKEAFIEKAIAEVENGNETIMLLPNDTSAKWFSVCVKHAMAIAFICNGRISFINNTTGKNTDGNNAGSILVLFAKKPVEQNVARTLYVTKKHLLELGVENE